MLLVALAIAPGLAICVYILYRDVYNREPAINMILSFVFGACSIVPALSIERFINPFLSHSIASIIVTSFFGVALVEELCKFFVLRYYSFTRHSFDEPLDGIVYSVLVSMGFATVENVFYVYNESLSVAFLRMFTSVPAHATFAVIMGYFVGKAKFNREDRKGLFIKSILGATLAHGTYDAFLLLGENAWVKQYISELLLFSGAIASLYITIRLSRRLIRLHHITSQQLFDETPVLSLRKASDKDVLLIRELSLQVWPQTYATILSAEQIQYMLSLMYSEAALHQQLADDHHFYIVYNAGIPIGFVSYSAIEPHLFKLHKIYILPLQQGRGTGRFILEQVIAQVKKEGATALQLNVNRNNKALEFYRKQGFIAIREEDNAIGNGYFMNDYVLEKKLTDDSEADAT
ncbi:MAG TPA: GNAT family N-acetyltransferase [Chitinophagaceae bacterium]|nr:GNAT family N-acetyltransferase [Chitinophagaceae bacterium]